MARLTDTAPDPWRLTGVGAIRGTREVITTLHRLIFLPLKSLLLSHLIPQDRRIVFQWLFDFGLWGKNARSDWIDSDTSALALENFSVFFVARVNLGTMWSWIVIVELVLAVSGNIREATKLLGILMAIKLCAMSSIPWQLTHSVRFWLPD